MSTHDTEHGDLDASTAPSSAFDKLYDSRRLRPTRFVAWRIARTRSSGAGSSSGGTSCGTSGLRNDDIPDDFRKAARSPSPLGQAMRCHDGWRTDDRGGAVRAAQAPPARSGHEPVETSELKAAGRDLPRSLRRAPFRASRHRGAPSRAYRIAMRSIARDIPPRG